jgi:hypothetical protein
MSDSESVSGGAPAPAPRAVLLVPLTPNTSSFGASGAPGRLLKPPAPVSQRGKIAKGQSPFPEPSQAPPSQTSPSTTLLSSPLASVGPARAANGRKEPGETPKCGLQNLPGPAESPCSSPPSGSPLGPPERSTSAPGGAKGASAASNRASTGGVRGVRASRAPGRPSTPSVAPSPTVREPRVSGSPALGRGGVLLSTLAGGSVGGVSLGAPLAPPRSPQSTPSVPNLAGSREGPSELPASALGSGGGTTAGGLLVASGAVPTGENDRESLPRRTGSFGGAPQFRSPPGTKLFVSSCWRPIRGGVRFPGFTYQRPTREPPSPAFVSYGSPRQSPRWPRAASRPWSLLCSRDERGKWGCRRSA